MQRATIQTKHGDVTGYETPFGILALVRPSWLDKDTGEDGYQRPYDPAWARRIAAMWDYSKARPINARLRDGLLWITNGQHTAEAAMLAGVEEILVVINNGSPSRIREAQEFVAFQRDVKRMRPFDQYRASLVAGDTDALIVRKLAKELGFTVGTKRQDPFVLTTITAARDIAEQGGEDRLRDVLQIVMKAWEDHSRFKYEILAGVNRALDVASVEDVQRNAQKWGTAASLFAKQNAEAGGKGYVTISNIGAALNKRQARLKRGQIHEG